MFDNYARKNKIRDLPGFYFCIHLCIHAAFLHWYWVADMLPYLLILTKCFKRKPFQRRVEISSQGQSPCLVDPAQRNNILDIQTSFPVIDIIKYEPEG